MGEVKVISLNSLFSRIKPVDTVKSGFVFNLDDSFNLNLARDLFINKLFAKHFSGSFNLFINDLEVKPSLSDLNSILKWLDLEANETINLSSFLNPASIFAQKLMNIGKAYICTCSKSSIAKNQSLSKSCDCRYNHFRENLILWLGAAQSELPICLRLRTDIKHKDSSFRDPIIYDSIISSDKKKLIPVQDFLLAVAFVSSNISNYFYSNSKNKALFDYLVKLIGKVKVKSQFIGILNISSKTPNLFDLKSRSIIPLAIKNYILSLGISSKDKSLSLQTLYSFNKQFLDGNFVSSILVVNPVRLRVQEMPAGKVNMTLKDKNSYSLNSSELIYISRSDKYSLKEKSFYKLFGHIKFCRKNAYNIAESDLDFTDKSMKTIYWLPFSMRDSIEVSIRMADNSVIEGIAQTHLKKLIVGTFIYFEGFGYCKLIKKSNSSLSFVFSSK